MTPLARKVAEIMLYDRKSWKCYSDLLKPFPDGVRCFDITAVRGLIGGLAKHAAERGTIAESMAFLPAPATWIEHSIADDERPLFGVDITGCARVWEKAQGYLLVQKDNNMAAIVSMLGYNCRLENGREGYQFSPIPDADIPLLGRADADQWALESAVKYEEYAKKEARFGAAYVDKEDPNALDNHHFRAYWMYAALSVINTPRIVAQDVHKPKPGLQRRLSRAMDRPYQLLPWHTIKLDVTDPTSGHGDGQEGGRMTGAKAYHFCRSFLRIRLGKLERVKAHWRGDPTRGIVQGSYRVTADG